MKKGGLLVGLVLVVVLAVFVWFDLRREERSGKLREMDLIFAYNVSRVGEVAVTLGSRHAILRRGPGGWEAISGPEGVVPAKTADFLAAWSRVRHMEIVQEDPSGEDLERYGLQPPVVVVTATILPDPANREAQPVFTPKLELGGAAPLSPSYYARLNGFARVVLVSFDVVDLSEGVGLELFGEASRLGDARGEGRR